MHDLLFALAIIIVVYHFANTKLGAGLMVGGVLTVVAALSAILIFLIGSHAIKKAGGIDTVLITTAQIVGFFVIDAYFVKFVEKMKWSNPKKQLGLIRSFLIALFPVGLTMLTIRDYYFLRDQSYTWSLGVSEFTLNKDSWDLIANLTIPVVYFLLRMGRYPWFRRTEQDKKAELDKSNKESEAA